jgi:hypothetical protein
MATERVTAPLVKKVLDEHLQRHELKIDPKLHDVHEAVFGKGNIGGLCDEVERLKAINLRLQKIEDGLNRVLWVVGLAVLGAVLKLVILP